MDKVTVTLRGTSVETIEIPEDVERSEFGALRFFPGVPKGISAAEHAHIKATRPDLYEALSVSPYIESKRVLARVESLEELHAMETPKVQDAGKVRKKRK